MTTAGPGLLDPAFLSRVEQLSLQVRRTLRGTRQGEKRSRRQGTGLLFAGHRGYVPGDDLRHLDWNLLARLDRPFMKLFEEETDLTVHLLVDASRSMSFGSPSKYTAAARLAAVLAYIALTSLDRVGIGLVGGGGLRLYGPSRGKAGFYPVLRFLESARIDGTGSIAGDLKVHAAAGSPGLAILFSDFLDPALPEAFLAHRFRRHQMVLVQLLSPEETDPPYDGDLKLLDSEGAGEVEVTLGPREREAYLERLAAHRESLRRFSMRHGAAFLSFGSDLPLERAVWDHLLGATFVGRR